MTTIELHCEIRARSELAVLIFDGHKTVWIPRSEIIAMAIHEGTTGDPHATLTLPDWLVREKGINTDQRDDSTADLFGGAA
jgi:hypothetical protein